MIVMGMMVAMIVMTMMAMMVMTMRMIDVKVTSVLSRLCVACTPLKCFTLYKCCVDLYAIYMKRLMMALILITCLVADNTGF